MIDESRKLISVVIPAYDEASNLPELYRRLNAVFSTINSYRFEVILVDNGSRDNTWFISKSFCEKDTQYRAIRLSRNFTAAGGITAGLRYAKGEAAIVMCADLQDPPEKIPDFIAKWEEGYEVVYHIVEKRKGVSFLRAFFSEVFHSTINRLTSGAFPKNASVYRLIDKKAYEAFNSLSETNRYFAGLCSWVGFSNTGLVFEREKRFAGESKAPLTVVVKLALDAIFSFSYVPLRLVTILGLALATGAAAFLFYLMYVNIRHGMQATPGYATQMGVLLLLFGALFLAIGTIGEYIARIYDEVKRRPNFIVRDSI
jgi:dolichol-phosphate mannosyltransferase